MNVLSRSAVVLVFICQLPAIVFPVHFDDFRVTETWDGSRAPLNIQSRAERAYRTRLTTASKQPPNFAGHYRVTVWGCGSNCISGAVIDLATGSIIPLPDQKSHAQFTVCQSAYDGSGVEYRLDSTLMIVKCGLNYIERLDKNVPDAHYFFLSSDRFIEIMRMHMRKH